MKLGTIMKSLRTKRYFLLILVLQFVFLVLINLNFNTNTTNSLANNQSNSNQIFPPLLPNEERVINHRMELTIRTDFTIRVESTLVIENNNTEPLYFFIFAINKTISSVFVSDPYDTLLFTWAILDESSVLNITLREPLLQNEKHVITILYELSETAYPISDYYSFEFKMCHWMTTHNFQLAIFLPSNYGLIEEAALIPLYPEPDKIYTRYNLLVIEWELSNVVTNYEYLYAIRFKEIEPFSPTIIYVIPKIFYFYLTLAFIGGILISGSVSYLFVVKKYQPEKQKLVSSLLSNSEQAVLKAINDEGGVAIQRRICERTGFSKSKVSQLLLKLEEKNILKRERWGRTNRVTITDDSFLNIDLEESPSKDVEKD
jgi:hypothetical protein